MTGGGTHARGTALPAQRRREEGTAQAADRNPHGHRAGRVCRHLHMASAVLLRTGLLAVHRSVQHQLAADAGDPVPCGAQRGQADHRTAAQGVRRTHPITDGADFRHAHADPHTASVPGGQPRHRHERGLLVHVADRKRPAGRPGCGAQLLCQRRRPAAPALGNPDCRRAQAGPVMARRRRAGPAQGHAEKLQLQHGGAG